MVSPRADCAMPKKKTKLQINKYGLHALKHAYNQGLIFKDFEVPKKTFSFHQSATV